MVGVTLLDSLLNTIPHPVFIRNLEGRFIASNRAFEKCTGFTGADFNGGTALDPASGKLEEWRRVIDLARGYETRIEYSDGSAHDVVISKSAFNDESGRPSGTVGIILDTTERRRAEAELMRETEIKTALAEVSRLLMAEASIGDISDHVLRYARDLTGSRFGFVGYVDPKNDNIVAGSLTLEAGGESDAAAKEAVFTRLGGLWNWVIDNRCSLLTNHPAQDARSTGTPPGHVPIDNFLASPAMAGQSLMGIVALANSGRDYTEMDQALVESLADSYALAARRMWTEQELRRAKEFAENLVETADAVVVLRDLQGSIWVFNRAAEEVTGYRRDEVIGRNWFEFISPRDRYPESSAKFEEFRGGKVFEREPFISTILTKSGEERYISWRSSEMREHGEVLGLISIGTDITESKQREKQLEDLNRELQAFASTLSHDLKSPLGNALGYAATLRRIYADRLDETGKEGLSIMVNSLEKINGIIEGMLEYTRAGQAGESREEIAVGLMVEGIVQEKRETGLMGGVDFSIAGDLPVVTGNPVRLYQVLANLISNAIKFAAGRPDAAVEVGCLKRGSHDTVYVKDNGPGVPPDQLERIFEPLARTGDALHLPGHGLGLAIVRRAVDSWGGRVWVDSVYGNGATFFFTLP